MPELLIALDRVRRTIAGVVLGPTSTTWVANAQTGRRPQASADSARHVADLLFGAVAEEKWDVATTLVDTLAIKRRCRKHPQRPVFDANVSDDRRNQGKAIRKVRKPGFGPVV